MRDLFLLSAQQVSKLQVFFPRSRGVPRVDDCLVPSGIIFVQRNGLRWRDAPAGYGPHKTLYYRWYRWRKKGILDRIQQALAAEGGKTDMLMMDSTHCKVHRTGASLWLKKGGPDDRCIGRTRGGLNARLHVVVDACGRPVRLLLTGGQHSDHKGARELVKDLPAAATRMPAMTATGSARRSGTGHRGLHSAEPQPQGLAKQSVGEERHRSEHRKRVRTHPHGHSQHLELTSPIASRQAIHNLLTLSAQSRTNCPTPLWINQRHYF